MKRCTLLGLILLLNSSVAYPAPFNFIELQRDNNAVIDLNKKGFENRLIDPKRGYTYARKALEIAKEIDYKNGEAEAYRIMGISKYYTNESSTAVAYFLNALSIYKQEKNILGQAKVYNNIGNLYIWADYDKALEYFNEALKLSKRLNDKELSANLFLNIGNIHLRKKNYQAALSFYEEGDKLYKKTNNEIGMMHCLQNKGKIYLELKMLAKAESCLIYAHKKAKSLNLNGAIASINLSLSSVYITKEDYKRAQKTIKEGIEFAKKADDDKLIYDFNYSFYELESQRRNFPEALRYLQLVYKQDSVRYANSESAKISLLEEQYRQKEIQRRNELIILRQKQNKIILISTLIVTFMAIVVIVMLAISVRRKMRVNQLLEQTVDERTKDLQIKNQKLSEYSAHLSHEIRAPIATLKGLLMLEEEKMISHEDLIEKIKICAEIVDEKIHQINDALNNPKIPRF
jgi:tetratricopeptide (TPR) repeat protein